MYFIKIKILTYLIDCSNVAERLQGEDNRLRPRGVQELDQKPEQGEYIFVEKLYSTFHPIFGYIYNDIPKCFQFFPF